jgi:hypothetical protein
VQLVTSGNVGVRGLNELQQLSAAADQVLYKYKIKIPMETGTFLSAEASKTLADLSKNDDAFSVSLYGTELVFTKKEWNELLSKQVLVLGSEWETYLLEGGEDDPDVPWLFGTPFTYPIENSKEFHAYAKVPIEALLEVKELFTNSS